MPPVDLETLVDRALRQLPPPAAPATLLPRVMAALQEGTERPWYERAWFTWPAGWKAASIAALILLVVGGAMVFPTVQARAADAVSTYTADVVADVAGLAGSVETTTSAAQVVWRTLLEPFVTYAFALVVLMCLVCVALGAALNFVLLERA
jgi:hypothetical protein